jgi:hypothetical protein
MILSEYEAFQLYDQMLDEVYPELFIGHSSFLASTVLKELWIALLRMVSL